MMEYGVELPLHRNLKGSQFEPELGLLSEEFYMFSPCPREGFLSLLNNMTEGGLARSPIQGVFPSHAQDKAVAEDE